jgi:hypothetical protein
MIATALRLQSHLECLDILYGGENRFEINRLHGKVMNDIDASDSAMQIANELIAKNLAT